MSFGPEDDVLENENAPRRRGPLVVGILVLVVAAVIPTAVHRHRASVLRHDRAAYQQLLNLSAAGEASIEQAVSQTRDVTQYAEPLLNSPQTTAQARATLYRQVRSAQDVSRSTIDAQLRLLSTDRTTSSAHRLRAARQATINYLGAWSAVFGPAGGVETSDDLDTRRDTALTALRAAAPDATLAALSDTVLGATQTVQ